VTMVRTSGYLSPHMRRLAASVALTLLGLGVGAMMVVGYFGNHHYSDFRIFWQAGRDVLQHHSPYPSPTATRLHAQDQFVYPAPAAVLMAAFALLPLGTSAFLFLVLSIVSAAASLHILGVRDVRCYAITFGSLPLIQGLVMGTVTPLLMLTLALTWRYRNRVWPIACTAAVAIGLKLFLAPLGIWLVGTRRWRALLASVGASAVLLIGCWSIVGASTLAQYPKLLSELTKVEGSYGYSTYAFALRLGLAPSAAHTVVLSAVGVLAVCVVAIARRPHGDPAAFALAVVACLVASPIVWLHYFALLVIPVAVLAPRLSWLWVLPLAGWLFPNLNHPAATWKIVGGHMVLALLTAIALRSTLAAASGQPAGHHEMVTGAAAPTEPAG